MEALLSKKFILITLGFLVVLALVTSFGLRWYSARQEAAGTAKEEAARQNETNAARNIKENRVNYIDDGFSPKELTIAADRGLGCVVNVENQSTHALTVGLSPHNPVKDPGQNYLPVPPGENVMFDPRYSGYTELSFHDHERPQFEFTVKFEKSCQ
ncbi:MAG: hypothetical protein HYT39_03575 [Candidatus Sungbacteria bacterium]|nr:hypothetical protein [Candidatus Sungbacteria bacterium]